MSNNETLAPVPASVEIEEAFIAAMVTDPTRAAKHRDLKSEDFYTLKYAWIWDAILELLDHEIIQPDILTIAEQLKQKGQLDEMGGFAVLHQLVGYPSMYELESYKHIIKQLSARRHLFGEVVEVMRNTLESDTENDELLGSLNTALSNFVHRTSTKQPMRTEDVLKIIDASLSGERQVTQYKTGYEIIDRLLSWERTSFHAIGGRTGDGKSSLLLQVLAGLGRQVNREAKPDKLDELLVPGEKVAPKTERLKLVMYQLEDTRENTIARLVGILGNVPHEGIRRGIVPTNPTCKHCGGHGEVLDVTTGSTARCRCSPDPSCKVCNGTGYDGKKDCKCFNDINWREQYVYAVNNAMTIISQMDITIIDGQFTVTEFENHFASHCAQYGCDVLALDHLDLFKNERVGKSSYKESNYEKVTRGSNALREIANNRALNADGIIVIAAVQINRSGAQNTVSSKEYVPQLHHFRNSGDIEQDVHVALGVVASYDDNGKKTGFAKLHKMKDRHNGTEEAPVRAAFVGWKTKFEKVMTIELNNE